MTEAEKLLTQIGELVCTEIDWADTVHYSVRRGKITALNVVTNDGTVFALKVKVMACRKLKSSTNLA